MGRGVGDREEEIERPHRPTRIGGCGLFVFGATGRQVNVMNVWSVPKRVLGSWKPEGKTRELRRGAAHDLGLDERVLSEPGSQI